MRWIASVLIACLFLAARGEVVAGAEGADAAKIAEWIAQLGADEFEIREAASQRLENVAEENSEAIFAALAVVKDPEIRQRLARLAHLIQPGKTVLHFDGCSVTGVGVPCVSDGRVYVPCRDHFFCFDALDGRKVWTCDRVGFTFEGPAVADGRVFFHCMRRDEPHDGTLYCLNAADGREEWKLEGYPSGNFTSPIAVNGHVFFGAGELLVSVDAKTGKEEWRFKAATTWLSTPTVADGKVLAGSVKGSLYCVSEADGKLL